MQVDIDELGKRLHAKLDHGIDRLKTVQAHLESLHKETETTIQAKLSAARETLVALKQEAAAGKAALEKFVEDTKVETHAAVAEWKAKRDRQKLEKRSERTRKYAEASIAVALCAVQEAEVAVLEAVAARRDVDDI